MQKLVKIIYAAIEKKKGEDIIVYDFHERNPYTDYAIITRASNVRQVGAIADGIVEALKIEGHAWHFVEGKKDSRWILVNAKEVIVHIFLSEEREVFNLEKLYRDLKQLDMS